MRICSAVNPFTAGDRHTDIFGGKALKDSCLCMKYSTDKWKILFSSDPGMFVLKKQKHNWKKACFQIFSNLGSEGGLFETISRMLKASCDSCVYSVGPIEAAESDSFLDTRPEAALVYGGETK